MHHLTEAGIRSISFSAGAEWAETSALMKAIRSDSDGVRLVFLTPEKVARSDAVMRLMTDLFQQGRLDRVVVDEVSGARRSGRRASRAGRARRWWTASTPRSAVCVFRVAAIARSATA